MSATTMNHLRIIRVRRALAIQWIKILIILSLVLITMAILVKESSTPRDSYKADRIPLVQNSMTPVAVPVPTPPVAYVRTSSFKTPIPPSMVASEPSAMPVPVPTPPPL